MIDDVASAPVEYQVDRIREALVSDPRVQELGLLVTIRGDTVMVSGPVGTPERSAAVEDVVHTVLPGATVRNDTDVVDLSGPGPEHSA